MPFAITLWIIFGFPLGAAVALVIGWYFLKHPEKFEKWFSMLAWALSNIWEKFDYYATKAEIQGLINSFVSTLEESTTSTFPRISLQWTARGKDELVWEEGRAVLVMRDRGHRSKNLIHAAYLFTSESLLKRSERHLSSTQKVSLDLFSTKLILDKENKGAVEQFIADFINPEVDKNDAVRELLQKFIYIERLGAFFPILIQELTYLGSKVFLARPSNEIIIEVKSLVDFLETFAQRQVGDTKVPDVFVGKYMRCAIRIVASRYVREKGDITSHKIRLNRAVKDNFENLYIIGGSGELNRDFMDDVIEACLEENPQLAKVRDYNFSNHINIDGRTRKVQTYLVHLHNPGAVKYLYEANDLLLTSHD